MLSLAPGRLLGTKAPSTACGEAILVSLSVRVGPVGALISRPLPRWPYRVASESQGHTPVPLD